MELQEKFIALLGKDWYEELKHFLHTSSFLDISKHVTQERKKKTIYPSSDRVFRAFRETGYLQTKVVLLGQDPYFDGIGNGLAFCCGDSIKEAPSLQKILKEIDIEYPEYKDDLNYGRLVKQDLTRWARQGVLLLNRALTVEKNRPKSHLPIWKFFTDEVIKTINKKHDVVFILLGKDAQQVKPLIDNTNFIIEAPHPAAEIYQPGIGFIGSGVFKQANEYLSAISNKEIMW